MKQNSIKILALAALALTLGACGGNGGSEGSTSTSGSDTSADTSSEQGTSEGGTSEGGSDTSEGGSDTSEGGSDTSEGGSAPSIEELPTLYSIGEILSLDADNQWEHLGELVQVEELAVQGIYGNTIIGGTALGETIDTLRGLEIDCAELPTFEKGSGWGANITATGRLADVGGRAVIEDAVVTVVSEREYNEQGTSYTGGLPVYQWPAVYMNRANFDQYMGRKLSGIYLNGLFQIASMPEEVTPEQGTDFYVVFPGENLDTEDLDNYSLINIHVPEGLTQGSADAFNAFFAEKAVADFLMFDGCGQYDMEQNLGYGLVVDNWAARYFEDPTDVPDIYNSWEDIALATQEYFADPLPDLGDDRVFSYTYEYSGKATDAIKEEYVFLTDKENSSAVSYTFNYKPADAEDIVNGFVEKLETLGYVEGTGDLEGIFTLTVEENVVAELIIMGASESNLNFYLLATAPAGEPGDETYAFFETQDELLAAYEGRAGALVEGFASALLANIQFDALSYGLDWTDETAYFDKWADEIYIYDLTFAYGEDANPTEDSVVEALLANGFEAKRLDDYVIDGYFNATSNEFVADIDLDVDENTLIITVYALTADAVDTYITDIPDEMDYDTFVSTFNTTVQEEIATITGEASTYALSFADLFAGEDYAGFTIDYTSDGYYADYYTTFGLLTQFVFQAKVADGVDAYDAAYAVFTALQDAGFVQGAFNLFGASGLWNAETNEFVMVSYTDNGVSIQMFVLDATSAGYVQTAA